MVTFNNKQGLLGKKNVKQTLSLSCNGLTKQASLIQFLPPSPEFPQREEIKASVKWSAPSTEVRPARQYSARHRPSCGGQQRGPPVSGGRTPSSEEEPASKRAPRLGLEQCFSSSGSWPIFGSKKPKHSSSFTFSQWLSFIFFMKLHIFTFSVAIFHWRWGFTVWHAGRQQALRWYLTHTEKHCASMLLTNCLFHLVTACFIGLNKKINMSVPPHLLSFAGSFTQEALSGCGWQRVIVVEVCNTGAHKVMWRTRTSSISFFF